MRHRELSTFARSLRRLPPEDKARVKKAILQFLQNIEGGALPPGLGVKKLGETLWELRAGLHLRVLFLMQGDLIEWGLVGSHADIRKFLRRIR